MLVTNVDAHEGLVCRITACNAHGRCCDCEGGCKLPFKILTIKHSDYYDGNNYRSSVRIGDIIEPYLSKADTLCLKLMK